MEDYTKKRAATRLIQKYGKKALPKAVEVARYYISERDDENARRWVSIGYEIKRILSIHNVNEILAIDKEAREQEEV